jgi:hypothetical protein
VRSQSDGKSFRTRSAAAADRCAAKSLLWSRSIVGRLVLELTDMAVTTADQLEQVVDALALALA